jgi:uncharacterized membrane protein YjgN (DUF898 family)
MSAITADDDSSIEGAGERAADRRTPSSGSSTTDGSAGSRGHELPIRFTASGSEYFRIWIVNLLLILATLGLYLPWAKVRKRRYFYGNTWIADQAFDFHGNPWAMLRGMLLVGALGISYSIAGRVSATAALIAMLVVAAVAPALLRSSFRFRLANTSWRGMRFHFRGSLGGAYLAFLPALPLLAIFGAMALLPELAVAEAGKEGLTPKERAEIFNRLSATLGGLMLLGLLITPLMMWSIKRYQHGHLALGRVSAHLRTGPWSFYLLFLKAFGLTLLIFIAMVGWIMLLGFTPGKLGSRPSSVLGFVVSIGVGYFLFLTLSITFVVSRLQNLVWNRTKSSELRFESDLRFTPLLLLTMKNWFLVACTLGLYWPFAVVSLARLKLQSVTVYSRHPVDNLAGRAGSRGDNDAAGDAAGDVFGLDVGF